MSRKHPNALMLLNQLVGCSKEVMLDHPHTMTSIDLTTEKSRPCHRWHVWHTCHAHNTCHASSLLMGPDHSAIAASGAQRNAVLPAPGDLHRRARSPSTCGSI